MAREAEAADLGREMKKWLNIIKMRIRRLNLLKGREVVKKLRLTRETTEPRRDHLQYLKENCQCSVEFFKITFQYSQLWTGLFVHAMLLCQIPELHFAQLKACLVEPIDP